jgi:hypothetical protein
MKSKINRKSYKKSRKNKKGGRLFSQNNYVAPSGDCDPNNLTSIQGSKALHENYQKCCPKGFMGTKNSSPYCKQVDLNFQAARKAENDANEYYGYQPNEVYQMKQQESTMNTQPQKKYWYKFWGGKKTRKHRK